MYNEAKLQYLKLGLNSVDLNRFGCWLIEVQ
jgi:hypothetical protein